MGLSVAWLDTTLLIGSLAASSLAGYQQDLTAYLRFCADPTTALQAASLARWRVHLAQETGISPSTLNRRLSAIKRVIREAAEQGYVDNSTAEAFRQVRSVPIKAMTARLRIRTRIMPDQMRQLCEAPDRATLRGWRDRALLLTLASSGCRASEVCSLTTGQIHSDGGSFSLLVMGKNQTAPRQAPLAHDAYAAVQAWLSRRALSSPYVFTSLGGKARPLDRSAAWRIVDILPGMNAGASTSAAPSPIEGSGTA